MPLSDVMEMLTRAGLVDGAVAGANTATLRVFGMSHDHPHEREVFKCGFYAGVEWYLQNHPTPHVPTP